MKVFWMNLSKQKFMNWAAGAIVLYFIVNNFTFAIFLSSNVKLLTPIVYERIMNNIMAQQKEIIMMVLLYYFSNKLIQDNQNLENK